MVQLRTRARLISMKLLSSGDRGGLQSGKMQMCLRSISLRENATERDEKLERGGDKKGRRGDF